MCQSNAFILEDGKENEIMRDVALLEPSGDEIRLVDLFGEEKRVRAKIKMINLMEHRIILEPVGS